jgi:glycolate oxidase iron-sulfur subunit
MAFDVHKPPSKELIEDCVHCGFCLPTCPTYVLWGEEMDSPRGRIVLMNTGLKEDGPMSPTMATHFDRCLGCMACVTACPSGVRYDELIESVRPQVERNYERPGSERMFREAIFALFTHPARLRALVPLLAASRPLRRRLRNLDRWPRLSALNRLAPPVRLSDATARLPEWTPAAGSSRGTVGLLQGCVQRVFFHHVNTATASVLAAEGFEVYAPPAPACCGALLMHSGEEPRAAELAKKTIRAFETCDFVAVNAAGCGSSMKDYPHLFDNSVWHERAAAFSAKVRDVSELLAEHEPRARRGPVPLRVAYHDACHLAHAQRVRDQPRALLKGIPELELLEPKEWELCCGSAGIYNLLQPRAADELAERKVANLLATGAEAIAAGNPGCTLQITAKLREAGRPIPMYHPMELLAKSMHAASPATGPSVQTKAL